MSLLDISQRDTIKLRFAVGDRVLCNVGVSTDGTVTWADGTVIELFYTQRTFPPGKCAPYQIRLDTGGMIYASRDGDHAVRNGNPKDDRVMLLEAAQRASGAEIKVTGMYAKRSKFQDDETIQIVAVFPFLRQADWLAIQSDTGTIT